VFRSSVDVKVGDLVVLLRDGSRAVYQVLAFNISDSVDGLRHVLARDTARGGFTAREVALALARA